MVDFKATFNELEKDPEYFLGCAIEWDPITGIIKLDPGKYLREIVAKYDMTDIHSDSWSLSHLGYLYPGTTPVMIKLDYNRSCPWV